VKVKLFYILFAAAFTAAPIGAQDAAAPAPTEDQVTETPVAEGDDDWLNTVWTQVDDMVEEEEFKLQETVTVAGVRGAEAEDNILGKLYYKGGKRYPSQDKLKKAIETLKKSIADQPKGENAPKQKYFLAQCYEKMGQKVQAKQYYGLVAKDHPQSSFAAKAQKQLAALK